MRILIVALAALRLRVLTCAEKATRESLEILRDVREEYGLPWECRG